MAGGALPAVSGWAWRRLGGVGAASGRCEMGGDKPPVLD